MFTKREVTKYLDYSENAIKLATEFDVVDKVSISNKKKNCIKLDSFVQNINWYCQKIMKFKCQCLARLKKHCFHKKMKNRVSRLLIQGKSNQLNCFKGQCNG